MTRTRLERLAPNLTPKQIILAWIKEMQSRSSFADHLQELAQRPPGKTIFEMIEKSVQDQLGHEPKVNLNAAVRRAQREAGFLGNLARECSLDILTGEESFWLGFAAVGFMLDNMRLRLRLGEDLGPTDLDDVQVGSAALRTDCLGHQLAVKVIEAEYFDGQAILSADAAGCLEVRRKLTEPLAALVQLNPKIVGRSQTKVAQSLVSRWVGLAKIGAHKAMGEDGAAGVLATRALDGRSKQGSLNDRRGS